MKVRCTDNTGVKAFLTVGKLYDAVLATGHYYFRLTNDKGESTLYVCERFAIVHEEPEEPKMGAIYMICVIINTGLKTNDYDVIPDDLVNETFIEHTLDAAKKKLDSLSAGIQEEGKSVDLVACIFELHSYYENRPVFVEVKS